MAGQRRAVAYVAAEALLWGFWAARRSRAADLRDAYRDLAWSSARLPSGPRRDGSWAYYEHLSKWARSGAFDRDPSRPGIQPEDHPSTFNGSVWILARSIHFGGGEAPPGDPRYEAAIAWYRTRAYGEGFLWDWRGNESALGDFRRLIDDSDRRFRQATNALGAILANHVLSGADAFLSSHVPGTAQARIVHGGLWDPGGPLGIGVTWTTPW